MTALITELQPTFISATKFFPAAGLFFDVPTLVSDVNEAIASQDPLDKIHHVAQVIISSTAMAEYGLSFLDGLKDFGFIAADAVSWLPIASAFLFPLSIFTLETGIFSVYRGVTTKMELDEVAPKLKKTESLENRIKNITQACKHIAKNEKRISKALDFSEKAALGARAENILKDLSQSNEVLQKKALEEGEAMMKTLRTRAHTKIVLGVLSTAIKATSVVLSGLVLFGVTTPGGPFIIGAVVVAGVALIVIKGILLTDNPFVPPQNVWHEKVKYQIRESIHNAAKEVLKIPKKVVQTIKAVHAEAEYLKKSNVPMSYCVL